MNRHAFQAALGRGSSRSSTSSLSTPTAQYFKTIHTAPGAARSFSSTAARPDSDSSDKPPSDNSNSNNSTPSPNRNGRERSEAAAQKLASLSRRYSNSNGPSSSSDRPFTPRRGGNFDGNNSSNFRGNFRGNNAREGGIIDARSLRSAPAPSSLGSGDALAAPRIINIRSIRGGAGFRGRGGGRFAGRGGASASADGSRPPRFANAGPGRGGFGTSFRGGAAGARTGGFGAGAGGPGARFAGPGRSGARGRGARGRGDGAGGRGGRREGKKDEEERKGAGGKMVFLPEEQAVIDRMEKGVVVPFNPDVTYQSLSGYGAAIATDAPLGQVETAIRAMRAMTGGMAFNADSGVTADITAIMKRHDKKQPIFVHSKEEKAWIEAAKPKHMLSEPTPDIKKAIVDAAILGKHETPKFAEVGDTQAVMANYHGRTFTYRASDSQRFMDKVLALMPKPAAQASKRA